MRIDSTLVSRKRPGFFEDSKESQQEAAAVAITIPSFNGIQTNSNVDSNSDGNSDSTGIGTRVPPS